MMTMGVILWVLILARLVCCLYPSQEMRRDHAANGVYYGVWAILFGSLLLVQYHLMRQSGHVTLAMVSDMLGVSLGGVWLWAILRYREGDV